MCSISNIHNYIMTNINSIKDEPNNSSFHIGSLQVSKPINQVLSTLVDQDSGHQIEHDNSNLDESSGGPWQTKGTIHIQASEPALTNTTRENETLLAIGTAYVQGEDVAARGRVLLFSVENSTENSPAKEKCSLWWLNGDSNKAVGG
ncbi:putative cleavage/polyadenylation specificity factor, A subunit [Helianthus anomalus]